MGLFSGGTEIINNGELLEGGTATGTILPWSDSSVPSGYLECNGSAVSRATYSGLFAVIGTTYGAGNGSTTFNLPDLRDNVPVGKSGTKSLGSTGGANTVTSTGNVGGSTANATLSTAQLASHSHTLTRNNAASPQQSNPFGGQVNPGGSGVNPTGQTTTSNSGSGSGHAHNMSATFTGDASSVIQPYLTLIYIIKT
jgi:microcystin-dependent protein